MASDNPYQSPKTQSPPAPKKRFTGKLVFGILLLVGMVPASAVAFFCCCMAGIAASERPGPVGPDVSFNAGMAAGSVGGIVVFVLMLAGGIWLIRRSRGPTSA